MIKHFQVKLDDTKDLHHLVMKSLKQTHSLLVSKVNNNICINKDALQQALEHPEGVNKGSLQGTNKSWLILQRQDNCKEPDQGPAEHQEATEGRT